MDSLENLKNIDINVDKRILQNIGTRIWQNIEKDLAYQSPLPALQYGDAVCISFSRSLTTIVAEVVVALLLLL